MVPSEALSNKSSRVSTTDRTYFSDAEVARKDVFASELRTILTMSQTPVALLFQLSTSDHAMPLLYLLEWPSHVIFDHV